MALSMTTNIHHYKEVKIKIIYNYSLVAQKFQCSLYIDMFPPISIIGTSADSKDVTMEVQFGDPDVTQYYWRLYDSNRKGNQSHLAINSGNITRPGGGGLKTMGNTVVDPLD